MMYLKQILALIVFCIMLNFYAIIMQKYHNAFLNSIIFLSFYGLIMLFFDYKEWVKK